jgi:hypothetical protein
LVIDPISLLLKNEKEFHSSCSSSKFCIRQITKHNLYNWSMDNNLRNDARAWISAGQEICVLSNPGKLQFQRNEIEG